MTTRSVKMRFSVSIDRHRGFSLPELVIVVLIGCILAVIALPSGIRAVQLYSLDSAASIVVGKMMEARMSAIKRNRTTRVRIDSATRSIAIISTNADGHTITVDRPYQMPQGLQIESGSTVEVSFDSMGRAADAVPVIVMRENRSGKRKNVTVSPSGKIALSQMY